MNNIPSAYIPGYVKARDLERRLASSYLAHTVIGDPDADALMNELADFPLAEANRLIQAAVDGDHSALANAPPTLLHLFNQLETPPDWVDQRDFAPGIRMFHRNSRLILGAFVGGVLVEGFSTNISKSFFITGRLRDQGVRRLKQNNRHMVELFVPGGLERDGDGWKLSVRVRLLHAQIRRLLAASEEWDAAAWGAPVSAAHLGLAITAFSARLVRHIARLGAVFNDEERESFISVWRYCGHLMGIPEAILFRDEEDALKLFAIGSMCEPEIDLESIVMVHALINSAPLVIGITDTAARRRLTRYVFSVSRALIGDELADQLRYPKRSSFGVLPWFRFQKRYQHTLGALFPNLRQGHRFDRFSGLLEASMLGEIGISYNLPDHVYAEESRRY